MIPATAFSTLLLYCLLVTAHSARWQRHPMLQVYIPIAFWFLVSLSIGVAGGAWISSKGASSNDFWAQSSSSSTLTQQAEEESPESSSKKPSTKKPDRKKGKPSKAKPAKEAQPAADQGHDHVIAQLLDRAEKLEKHLDRGAGATANAPTQGESTMLALGQILDRIERLEQKFGDFSSSNPESEAVRDVAQVGMLRTEETGLESKRPHAAANATQEQLPREPPPPPSDEVILNTDCTATPLSPTLSTPTLPFEMEDEDEVSLTSPN